MPVWDRVEDPLKLPAVVTPEWVSGLDDQEFDLLLRGHLLPRSAGEAGRRAWESLWRVLGDWPDLQGDAQEALSAFLSDCDAELLAHPDNKRVRRFQEQVLARVRGLDPGRLEVGGPRSRAEQLVAAIARHRRATLDAGIQPSEADVALWAVLDRRRHRR